MWYVNFLYFHLTPQQSYYYYQNETLENSELTWLLFFLFVIIDYIAECVDTFLTEQGLEDQEVELNLGYTFSFPVLQSRVSF